MFFFNVLRRHNYNVTNFTRGRDKVILEDIAKIRTGLVATRKKKADSGKQSFEYKLLNLKCVADNGQIHVEYAEQFMLSEQLKSDYITQQNDILVRLSAPYTSVFINRKEYCGFVIPSHFAIVRVNLLKANPEFVYWMLSRNKTRNLMFQNSRGGTTLSTINAGLISNLHIRNLPLSKQSLIGEMAKLERKEQELLNMLTEEKQRYASLLLNQIYDNAKER
jgi:restriction endonuclease S subunit